MKYFARKSDRTIRIMTDNDMIIWKWVWMRNFITLDEEGTNVIKRTFVEVSDEDVFLEML